MKNKESKVSSANKDRQSISWSQKRKQLRVNHHIATVNWAANDPKYIVSNLKMKDLRIPKKDAAATLQYMKKSEFFYHPTNSSNVIISCFFNKHQCGRTDKWKEWRDKNLSGCYHLVEIYNERPVYKVSFIFSEMKRLKTLSNGKNFAKKQLLDVIGFIR